MESSLSSIYATSLPKSPSMITTKRTTSTNFLQVNNCSHMKTRNGNLMNKLQKSLNNFIKHHKTTITLSGSKRFSDKSGIYYLKNSNHKCNLNDNYLTPIPSIKKINSHYESYILMASPERFERPTDPLEGDCSIQLSYEDINHKQ